jgi:hypothetical protein
LPATTVNHLLCYLSAVPAPIGREKIRIEVDEPGRRNAWVAYIS